VGSPGHFLVYSTDIVWISQCESNVHTRIVYSLSAHNGNSQA
jgi:hypothetical protein